MPGLLTRTAGNANALPPYLHERRPAVRVGSSGGPHRDRETRGVLASGPHERQRRPAAHEGVGGRRHRLEADEVLALRRVDLGHGIAPLEPHLEPTPGALEREPRLIRESAEQVVVDAVAEGA